MPDTPITWTNVKRKLSELIEWVHNPRQITEKQGAHLQVSIRKFGFAQPFLISPENDIYDGHQRKALMGIMQEYGYDAEIDCRVSSRMLTEDEQDEFVIRLRENTGEYDWDILANHFEVEELVDWGFPQWKLDEFMPVEEPPEKDAEPQTNRAEELREQWGVELGQMWRLPSRVEGQEHRLFCGDCTDGAVVERVMGGEKIDAVVTDPPYGMSAVSSSGVLSERYGADIYGDKDNTIAIKSFTLCQEHKVPQIWWGANYYSSAVPESAAWLVWDKNNGQSDQADAELAWSNLGGVVRIFKQASEKTGRAHPTQKHHALISWCIAKTGKSLVIYDPFCGSGTTIIAAENLSRQCRAIEISPAYVAVSLQRYVDAFGIEPELVT